VNVSPRSLFRGAFRALRSFAWAALAAVGRAAARRGAKPIGEPRRVLILQLQQLGDSVIFSPTLRALRERLRDAEIDVVASPIASQLYAKSPHINKIIRADGWGMRGKRMRVFSVVRVFWALRARRYDWVIADATETSFRYALAAFVAGARVRIGFDVASRGWLFTHRLVLPDAIPLAKCNLEIARLVGANTEAQPEEISFDESDVEKVSALLAAHGVSASRRIVVLHPGSNWQSKLWLADRFAKVADTLARARDCSVVLVGTAREAEEVESTRQAMQMPSVSLLGKTSLTELAALCARASLFIGTDSGPRNVAGAVGVPAIVAMSAQEETGRWFGYRPSEVMIRADARCMGCYLSRCAHRLCMRSISAEDVITLALERFRVGAPPSALFPQFVEAAVPDRLYVEVAGTPTADCSTLRRLARMTAA
jgi:ADP-heptose:LPS heptosyltransferase